MPAVLAARELQTVSLIASVADIESALGLITNEALIWTLHTLHGINKTNTFQESVHLLFFSKQNVFVNSQDLMYFYCNLIIVRKKVLLK